MNDLLELTVGEMTAPQDAVWPAKRNGSSLGFCERERWREGEKEEEKEGKVDSLCPSCHGIAIPELPGVLPLREQLFTR
jgi:hypothetical protein